VAFRLVPDIHQDELVVHPEDLPHQHGIDRQRGGADGVFARVGPPHGLFDVTIQFVAGFQFADEVAVDHACGGFGKTGWRKGTARATTGNREV